MTLKISKPLNAAHKKLTRHMLPYVASLKTIQPQFQSDFTRASCT